MANVAGAVWQATKTHPVTCPPFTDQTFNIKVFEFVDIIWLGLHGVPQNPSFLYGDEIPAFPFPIRIRALAADGIATLNLEGKIVYASTCFLPQTHFPEAFKKAGATIIGGPGENYGAPNRPEGADKLGMELLRNLTQPITRTLEEILEMSKRVLGDSRADTDAKEFKIL